MNTFMWDHPVTEGHIRTVKSFGAEVYVVPPITKKLICGDEGVGAMAETEDIAHQVAHLLQR